MKTYMTVFILLVIIASCSPKPDYGIRTNDKRREVGLIPLPDNWEMQITDAKPADDRDSFIVWHPKNLEELKKNVNSFSWYQIISYNKWF